MWFAFVKIIGCQPEQSAVMSASVKAGKILDLPSGETLSDGTAGGVEPGSVSRVPIQGNYYLIYKVTSTK